MNKERHVKLFRNGRNQAVRIPKEFEFEGDEAILKRDGDRLILEPVRNGGLLATVRALGPLAESFPDIDDFDIDLDELQGMDRWLRKLRQSVKATYVAA